MKTNSLMIAAFIVALGFSSCQNNATKSETDHSSMDSNNIEMDSMPMNSGMQSAMDKMMKEMHQMEMTGNVDYDLISMLKSHHQGAIDMARAELASGTETELRKIAQNIVDEQSKEIQMLNTMLERADKSNNNYNPTNKESGLGKDLNANMIKMMEMNHDTLNSVDHQFVSMMSKHHKDGIDMGKIIIKHSKMAEFKSMAQKMINDQTREIAKLETARAQL